MREGEGGREMREGGKMCNVGNVVGPRWLGMRLVWWTICL